MFLKRLKLQNIRSIKELEMTFDSVIEPNKGLIRKRTFILGENGTGKSSVLKAIALVTAGSEALREILYDPDSWIRNGEDECRIEAVMVTADREERVVSLHWGRGEHFKDIISRNAETLELLDDALAHTARNYFVVGYGTSRRLTGGKFSNQRNEVFEGFRARNVATLFSVDAVMNSLENWAIDLDYRKGKTGIEIVNKTFDELLPGLTFSHIDKEARTLIFDTQDGKLPLSLLSDGYQSMAGWCGDLLYRITETFGDYKNPLDTRGLLLIDELELHLHPVWQRSLITFLNEKLPRMQVVVTTHSLLTAHEAGHEELYFLQRAEESQPAELIHYEGTPNRMFAHQMLMMPEFGLETINSKVVEDMKEDYNRLKGKKRRKKQETEKLAELADEIEDLPTWTRGTELEEAQLKALESIEKSLE